MANDKVQGGYRAPAGGQKPPLPKTGSGVTIEKATGAIPITVQGVTFRCYCTGILRYRWVSDDGLCAVSESPHSSTYTATVNGVTLRAADGVRARRFRSLKNAMVAAVKVA
jgi:hypothetical protein